EAQIWRQKQQRKDPPRSATDGIEQHHARKQRQPLEPEQDSDAARGGTGRRGCCFGHGTLPSISTALLTRVRPLRQWRLFWVSETAVLEAPHRLDMGRPMKDILD